MFPLRARRWRPILDSVARQSGSKGRFGATAIGMMANNILPARAGDAIRVVLMAPRAECSKRTVVGTLLAERDDRDQDAEQRQGRATPSRGGGRRRRHGRERVL